MSLTQVKKEKLQY